MRKKFLKLAAWCFALALVCFVLAFVMFHFLTDGGFVGIFQQEAGKPFVTELVGDLGVLFLFGSILSSLAAHLFFTEK